MGSNVVEWITRRNFYLFYLIGQRATKKLARLSKVLSLVSRGLAALWQYRNGAPRLTSFQETEAVRHGDAVRFFGRECRRCTGGRRNQRGDAI